MAVKEFGPRTQIYGAGGDGAREATFEGTFKDSVKGSQGEGYLVVQAKFKKQPTTSKEDLGWLKRQADQELEKFLDPVRNLRRPEYYILATNIVLTPGAKNANGRGQGTLDAMREYLKKWEKLLNLKSEVTIWHADVLSSLLNQYDDIRRSFSSWVLSGDVLAEVLEKFGKPEFATVINRVVRDEIKDHRGVKTQESGRPNDERLHIDSVFIDLPLDLESINKSITIHESRASDASDHGEQSLDSEDPEDFDFEDLIDDSAVNVVNELMTLLSDRLNQQENVGRRLQGAYRRIVLLGGPGQGKSTIGQFLSQLLRARLIINSTNLPYDVRAIANATIKRAQEESIELNGPLRFPVHISLPKYADFISNLDKGSASLLRYITIYISKLCDREISIENVRSWLGSYPSLIVLDGLDEVPRASNRSDVIRAVERLVADVHEVNADTLILVTSRPQGYLNDFDERHWAHWQLSSLDKENAIRFSKQLANVAISDPDQRKDVIARLEEAAEDPSTEPLMVSPLQVSILFSLVQTRNDIPKDRWTLFERHYSTLRDREIAKGGINGNLIRDYSSDIDQIHFDTGFILQVRAEQEGKANAYFTLQEFSQLIKRNLSDSILDSEKAEKVAAQILEIATTRLVFLGDRNEGRISFDVRSLQEFMAAARLMASPESSIKERLTEIALKSHWAHVFRIACSKIYAQASLQGFREEILTILDKLDNGDFGDEFRTIGAGSRLAVALLADSTAGARETDRDRLMARAVKVLEYRSDDYVAILSDVADGITIRTLNRGVEEYLTNGGKVSYENSLRLLVRVSRRESHPLYKWAQDKLYSLSDIPDDVLASLVNIPVVGVLDKKSRNFLHSIIWALGPTSNRYMARLSESEFLSFPGPKLEKSLLTRASVVVKRRGIAVPNYEVSFSPIDSFKKIEPNVPDCVPNRRPWEIVMLACSFSISPTKENLALIVKKSTGLSREMLPYSELPWPISACLNAIWQGKVSAEVLAKQILQGEHGDYTAWSDIESSWKNAGVAFEDLHNVDSQVFRLLERVRNAPPHWRLSLGSSRSSLIPNIMRSHMQSSPSVRLRVLPLLCSAVKNVRDAATVARWIDDDLLEMPWNEVTNRRVASVIWNLSSSQEDQKLSIRLMGKVPLGTRPETRTSSEAIVECLMRSSQRAWAALSIYESLPLRRSDLVSKLSCIDPRILSSQPGDDEQVTKALVVLRAVSGRFDKHEVDAAVKLLLSDVETGKQISTLLRKMYSGQSDDENLDCLIRCTADAALASDFPLDETFSNILSELVASRKSCFDESESLKRLGLPADVS